jgi:uncharacterized OB-fold protein
MNNTFTSGIDEDAVLDAQINLPYTLTTGKAAGTFLVALDQKTILGTTCEKCKKVIVPATDYCGACGGQNVGFLEMPHTGAITAVTKVDDKVFIFVHLDGADIDLLHIFHGDLSAAKIGARVKAKWPESIEVASRITSLAGFELAKDSSVGTSKPFTGTIEPISEMPYKLSLNYKHSYGPHYGRMFDELATNQRIIGSRCSACHNVLVPPREYCDVCFAQTDLYKDVSDAGKLQAFSIINLEFVGQTRTPPYVYGEVVLDGSATRLIHNIGGFDITKAKEILSIGMQVKAVWRPKDQCKGTLDDIEYFQPVFD